MKKLETEQELRDWYKDFKSLLWNTSHIDLSVKADLSRIYAYNKKEQSIDFLYVPKEERDKKTKKFRRSLEGMTDWAIENVKTDESLDKIRELYDLSRKGYLCFLDVSSVNPRWVCTDWEGKLRTRTRADDVRTYKKEDVEWDIGKKEPQIPENQQDAEAMKNYEREKEIYDEKKDLFNGYGNSVTEFQEQMGQVQADDKDITYFYRARRCAHFTHSLQEALQTIEDADPTFLSSSAEYKKMKKQLKETMKLVDRFKKKMDNVKEELPEREEQLSRQLQKLQESAYDYIVQKKGNVKGKYGEPRFHAAEKLVACVETLQMEQSESPDWNKTLSKPAPKPEKKDSYETMEESLKHFHKFFTAKDRSHDRLGTGNCESVITMSTFIADAVERKKDVAGRLDFIENIFRQPYEENIKYADAIERVRNNSYNPRHTTYQPEEAFCEAYTQIGKRFQQIKTLDKSAAIWGKIAGVMSSDANDIYAKLNRVYGSRYPDYTKELHESLRVIGRIGAVAENRERIVSEFEKSENKQLTKEQAVDLAAATLAEIRLRAKGMMELYENTRELRAAKTTWRDIVKDSPAIDKILAIKDRKTLMKCLKDPTISIATFGSELKGCFNSKKIAENAEKNLKNQKSKVQQKEKSKSAPVM